MDPAREKTADVFELVFAAGFAGLVGVSSVLLGLLSTGSLRVEPLAALSAIVAVVVLAWAARSRRTRPRGARPSARSTAVALALVAASSLLFFRPAEFVFDGSDGSVYVAIARVMETQGTVTPADPLTAAMTGADRDALLQRSPWPELPVRFPGGMQVSDDGARLRPDFFPLFPAWMAGAALLFGAGARWYVNPGLALGGVCVLWLLGRRVAGALTGELAAGLLMINLAQIWFARVPSSEMAAQFLVLSGIYLAILAIDTRWVVAAAGSGAAFGLAAFARIDMLALVTPAFVLLLVLASRVPGLKRPAVWAAVPFALLTAQAVVYAFTTADRYTWQILSMLQQYVTARPGTLVVALAGLVAAAGAVAAARRTRQPPLRARVAVGSVVLVMLAFLMWMDFTRGYFQRPITPAGLAVGLAGLGALLLRPAGRRALPVILVCLVGMAYLRHPLDDRVVPAVFRRYVPILLPLMLLGFAHAVDVVRARVRLGAAPLLAPALLGAWFIWQTWPVCDPVMRGGERELARIAAVTEPSSLLVWDAAAPNHLALAAQYSLGRDSLLVPRGPAAGAAVNRLVTTSLAAGRPVYLAIDYRQNTIGAQSWRERFGDLAILPATSVRLRSERLVNASGPLPFAVGSTERRVDLYAVRRRGEEGQLAAPLRIDIGDRDLPYLLAGFYSTEESDDLTVRWTGAVARLRLPPLVMAAGRPAGISLRLATVRPDAAPVTLVLEWDGRSIGELRPTPELAEYHVAVDPGLFRPGGELTLRSDTFVPREVGLGEDGRTLGVMVDWIVIDSARVSVPVRQSQRFSAGGR